MKASELTLDSQISILMKGSFGFGKTLAAATFAVEGPIHISYWDKKSPVELVHFFRNVIKRPELLKNIEIDIFGAYNANEYLNRYINFAKDCRYFALITDSVTTMTSGAVNWSLSFRDDRKNKDKLKVIPDFDEYKVETSLVTQALDICRTIPAHIIWTCHPVPSIKIEGSGAGIKVIKTNPIVTYGSKVAGIVPGQFSEIYHFSKKSNWNSNSGTNSIQYMVSTDSSAEDDFAKSNIGLKGEFDITDKLFYDVWRERVKKLQEETNDLKKIEDSKPVNPFTELKQTQWKT
jgi:hypothetical protein